MQDSPSAPLDRPSTPGTKAELFSNSGKPPNLVALSVMLIYLTDRCDQLYATVGPATNEFRPGRLFLTHTTYITRIILPELTEKYTWMSPCFRQPGCSNRPW